MKFATFGMMLSCVSAQNLAFMPQDIAQASAQCTTTQSQDVAVLSYKHLYSSNADDCCAECSKDPKCMVAVLKGDECKLKDSVNLVDSDSEHMTLFPSSIPGPSPAPTPTPAQQCESRQSQDVAVQSYKHIYSSNADDCCAECSKDPKCKVAVLAGDECKLKDSVKLVDSTSNFMTMFPGSRPGPFPTPTPSPTSPHWYDGIDSIKVLTPEDDMNWRQFYEEMKMDQFSDKRWAVLLTSGEYPDADIGVGFYTSIVGVGNSRSDVVVNSFYAEDGPVAALQNFWRSVEGLTTTNATITWATSQATPVRRVAIEGDLNLASGPTGWASGGYLSDAKVSGRVTPMTQQQYFFRNGHFAKGVDTSNGLNYAFVGCTGDMEEQSSKAPRISVVPTARQIAEKPFLVEENGAWHIAVPAFRTDASGPSDELDVESKIPMEDVFVAKDGDSAATINAGIVGKRALLVTPAIYGLDIPIQIAQPGFVVLGIGMPSLVNSGGLAALEVLADDVRVAGVTFEAGSASSQTLVLWSGNGGVFSDVISRTGAFSYEREFHKSCTVTSQDVHLAITGNNLVVDNTWIWHADHDDCGGASDSCYSGHGILVEGNDVMGYGLKVEHTMNNLLQWNGERGTVYFFQSELPYNSPNFGKDRLAGYSVGDEVRQHEAVAIGVYIVGGLREVKAIHVPKSTNLTNAVAWCINCPAQQQFDAIVCAGSNDLEDGECYNGDCEWDKCRISSISTAGPPAHLTKTVTISSPVSEHSSPETGVCVELPGGVENDGTKLRAVACDESKAEQQWLFQGRQILHHAADGSDKCLDLSNGGQNDDDAMQIWYCVGTPQQQWGYEPATERIFLAQEDSRCLTVGEADDSTNGFPIKVNGCSSRTSQRWTVNEVASQSIEMVV